MALKTHSPLKTACACGIKGYPDKASAERALDRIKARKLRDAMPKRIVQCWRGRWHLEGNRPVDTGPDRETRAVVVERDNWACACCGKPIDLGPYSIQHRVARGAGGTSRPEVNSPANLVVLCGSATSPGGCHLAAEARAEVMHEAGFWLRSGEDPETVPVAHDAYGLVLLGFDGTVIPLPGGAA
jgi:5-methylcytosine-specific restriction protein A